MQGFKLAFKEKTTVSRNTCWNESGVKKFTPEVPEVVQKLSRTYLEPI